MLFSRYEKAYNRVNKSDGKFWKAYGVHKNLLNAIKSLYEITRIKLN
jgi:hypothetical protein